MSNIQLLPMPIRKFILVISGRSIYRIESNRTFSSHAPEAFNEFYNQRRRWVPSTMCNILDLLADAKSIVKKNNSISMPYIFYQGMLMVGTILGPGTIFLMMVGALVSVFSIDIWTSFLWNFLPLLSFMTICYFCKQKYQVCARRLNRFEEFGSLNVLLFQLIAAFVISAVYCLVMMAVMIGIMIQVKEDGILSPSSLFFFIVAGQIIITGNISHISPEFEKIS